MRDQTTIIDAIALSSPSGHMSKRARAAAQERLRVSLFGVKGLQRPACPQESKRNNLLRRAAYLRDLASRGMHVRSYPKEAARLEAEARDMK